MSKPWSCCRAQLSELRASQCHRGAARISGIHAFIINDKYLVSGTQLAATFLKVFPDVVPKAPAFEKIKTESNNSGLDNYC